MHKKTLFKALTASAFVSMTFAFAGTANAASVTYYLDQSNALTDGIGYVKVTISDSTVTSNINFKVETTSALIGENNFGILKFGFNPTSNISLTSANISGLAGGWAFNANTQLDGFGKFRVAEQGQSSNRISSLTFSIIGVNNDTIFSYANPSTGEDEAWVGAGNAYFAAEIDGFKITNGVKHAYFAGNTTDVPLNLVAAPVPAAAWLLGSGLIGLVGVARRKARGATIATSRTVSVPAY